MEVDEATIVTASTKRGASEDPQDAAKRLRTDDADAMDEAAARTRAEMTPAEREEAERLHRTAVRAEALAAAQAAAKERGVALSAAEVAALKKEQEAKPKFVSKCIECDDEYQQQVDECLSCGGETRKADRGQIEYADELLNARNGMGQDFIEILREIEMDLDIVDAPTSS